MLLVSIKLIDSALIDPRSRVLQLLARVHYQVHVHVRTVHVVHACKYGRESWIVYGDTTRYQRLYSAPVVTVRKWVPPSGSKKIHQYSAH